MGKSHLRGGLLAVGVALALVGVAAVLVSKEKMSPEELVARHLESVGPAAARAAVKSRTAEGEGQVKIVLGGTGSMVGPAELISEGQKVSFRLLLQYADYRGERLMFNGQTVEVGTVKDVKRSRLERFIHQFAEIMNEGLLGGTLSVAWPLAGLEDRQAKLEYQGMKRINDKTLHQVQYRAKRGSSELKIHLYFEPETFRHVTTVYELSVAAPMGPTPERSAQQLESRYKLEENFSDFRVVDGLTLPAHWTIRLNTELGRQTSIWEWDMGFTKIAHNQAVDPKVFELLQAQREPEAESVCPMEFAGLLGPFVPPAQAAGEDRK